MPLYLILTIIFGLVTAVIVIIVIRSILVPLRITRLVKLLEAGKLGVANRMAKKIIAKDASHFEAHYLLSECYTRDGKQELAFMELKTVGQIGKFSSVCPENEYRQKMAELYARFGQPDEALKEYLLLIRSDPNIPTFYLKAGALFEERNKPDVALAYYQKVIALDKGNAEGHLKAGHLYFKRKQLIEAQAELEKAINLNNATAEVFFILGKIHKEKIDFNTALGYFDRAVRDPDMRMRALVERGGCFLSLNNYASAVSDLERAVSLIKEERDTVSLYARYFLGLAYERMKNIDKSIQQWEKVYSQKPVFKDVAEKLSKYQEFRTDDALKDYLTASPEDFTDLCRKVVYAMGLTVKDITPVRNGVQIIAIDEDSSKWRNIKKLPKLMLFLRTADRIEDTTIRNFLEEMKIARISRGAIVTSSEFSSKAMEFSTSRPVELISKDQLLSLLNKAAASKD